MNLTRGIDLKKIAEKMNGCSGAELKGVCTEAGMYALRERRIHVTQEDFGMRSPSSMLFHLLTAFIQILQRPRFLTSTMTRKCHCPSCGSRRFTILYSIFTSFFFEGRPKHCLDYRFDCRDTYPVYTVHFRTYTSPVFHFHV